MKQKKILAIVAWLILNLVIGLFFSLNIINLGVVHAQDLTPPTLTILSPQDTTYFTNNIDLNFTVDEETSWIGYSLDGNDNVTISGNTTLMGLSFGSHTLEIYANDTSQNTGKATVDFTIFAFDFTPPDISIISAL